MSLHFPWDLKGHAGWWPHQRRYAAVPGKWQEGETTGPFLKMVWWRPCTVLILRHKYAYCVMYNGYTCIRVYQAYRILVSWQTHSKGASLGWPLWLLFAIARFCASTLWWMISTHLSLNEGLGLVYLNNFQRLHEWQQQRGCSYKYFDVDIECISLYFLAKFWWILFTYGLCDRPFTIMFFLADDTLEISEQYPLNCGRCKRQALRNETKW